MKILIPNAADRAEFEIVAPHNQDHLVVTLDGVEVDYTYRSGTVIIDGVEAGQTVEITEEPPHTIEGEAPMLVDSYPTITRIRFKINSLEPLPRIEPEEG